MNIDEIFNFSLEMVLLFKILQEFLVPSVFVFVLVLIGVILFFKRRQKTGKKLIILGIVLYYLFSITPVADLILLPLESQYNQIEKEKLEAADKIVLLLGGRESDVLRASEVLRLNNQQLTINNQQLKVIISGTDPINPQKKGAEEVKEFLVEQGIPDENIILESKSRNTRESARNIKEIVNEEPFFLVTSAYHMPRAMETFQKMGMNPMAAPTDFKIEHAKSARSAEASRNANAPVRIGEYDISDFFPDSKNLRKSDLAFHEYFGILYYRFFLL